MTPDKTPDKTPEETPEKTPEVSAHPLLGIHHKTLGFKSGGEWPTLIGLAQPGPKGLAPVNPKAFKHDGACTHSYSPGTLKA